MTRVLALVLVLAIGACSCSTAPVENAQFLIDGIKRDYKSALVVEQLYAERPDCPFGLVPVEQPCARPSLVLSTRRAGYDAESALVTADGERTASAIATARQKVDVYVIVAWELQ